MFQNSIDYLKLKRPGIRRSLLRKLNPLTLDWYTELIIYLSWWKSIFLKWQILGLIDELCWVCMMTILQWDRNRPKCSIGIADLTRLVLTYFRNSVRLLLASRKVNILKILLIESWNLLEHNCNHNEKRKKIHLLNWWRNQQNKKTLCFHYLSVSNCVGLFLTALAWVLPWMKEEIDSNSKISLTIWLKYAVIIALRIIPNPRIKNGPF